MAQGDGTVDGMYADPYDALIGSITRLRELRGFTSPPAPRLVIETELGIMAKRYFHVVDMEDRKNG